MQGVVRYKGQLVIPHDSELVNKLLYECHDFPVGGHSGEFKTYQRLSKEWYWTGMRKKVTQYVRECSICQMNKNSSLKPAGLLQPPSNSVKDLGGYLS